jgi:endonuclease YncB( thermonuclease family)
MGDTTNIKEELRVHGIQTPHISSCVSGLYTLSRLINVIDGDTIVCVLPVLGNFFKFNVRLRGIDTCELKSKDPSLRDKALKARDYLITRLFNYPHRMEKKETQKYLEDNVIIVYLHCYEFDKYGRLLADVYLGENNEFSLSEELIRENLAYPYEGGKKTINNDVN